LFTKVYLMFTVKTDGRISYCLPNFFLLRLHFYGIFGTVLSTEGFRHQRFTTQLSYYRETPWQLT